MNIGILPSVKSTKLKRVAKLEISVCSRHHKIDEQPNKKPKTVYYSHKRRESDDKNAVTIVKIVPRLGSIGFLKEENSPGKPDAKSLGTDSKNTIHSVYATSSKYPGK